MKHDPAPQPSNEQASKRQTIAAALIVGDNCSAGEWNRCIQSLVPWVDGIYVAYNGKSKKFPYSTPTRSSFGWGGVPFQFKRFRWEDNFSTARNQSFSLIPHDKFDWILWIDTDDTLQSGESLQDTLASLDPGTQGVFLKYEYGWDDDLKKVMVEQWRERLLRADCRWLWNYPVHEICHAPPGTQYARRHDVWVRHHRIEGHNDRTTRARNRKILSKWHKEEPEEARATFYLANEIYAEAHYARAENEPGNKNLLITAIDLYKKFMQKVSWDDDAYVANCRVAECYRLLGEFNKSVDQELQGMKVYPTWPEAYVGISQCFLEQSDWEKCRFWADAAIKLATKPDTVHVQEPMTLEYTPYLLRGIALQELGRLDEALSDYHKAHEFGPNSELSERISKLAEEIAKSDEPTDAEQLESKRLRVKNMGSQPEKSIAFVTRPSFETWHPEQEKKGGAGGAETCIMKLAPLFRRDGWRVVVFGTPGDFLGFDSHGVEYWDAQDYSSAEHFTVLVSSRAPEVFDSPIKADLKLLWMHDVNVGDEMHSVWGDRLASVDRVLGLTGWHIRHLNRLYGIDLAKMDVVPNGIELSPRFDDWDQKERKPHRFVYSSSPDRGVDVLMGLWPAIKRELPDAELEVFYGWNAIDKIVATNPVGFRHLTSFKQGVMGQVEWINQRMGGINWHDRVPQQQLADVLKTCDMWLYPTYFMETFCITALEMQAAGVIPLSSQLASLSETVADNKLLIKGYPNNYTYGHEFLGRLSYITTDLSEEGRQRMRMQGRRKAERYTWEAAYKKWVGIIERELNMELTKELVSA